MPTRIKAATATRPRPTKSLDAYQQLHDPLRERCSGRAAIDVVRGRWKASILHYLRAAPRRFMELQKELRGITDQSLTVQLRQLEADGVIRRTPHPGHSPGVEYSLTESGGKLALIMQQMETWGAGYLAQRAARDSHF